MKSLIANQQLFAEAYLRSLALALVDHTGAVRASKQTIQEWREFYPDLSLPLTLSRYVGQCLSALGLSYAPQGDCLVLYADQTLAAPIGLCLLVADENLGRTTKGRHHQANLVHALRQQSLAWGVLTNGRAWRLCHAAASAPYELHLEADLDGLLAGGDLAGFSLFHRFFGQAAFAMDGAASNGGATHGLDGYLAESENKREAIQRYLQGQVEPVLGSLCLGFVQDEGTHAGSRAALDEIYRNAIYLLYRILFLFYAEARNLLPLDDPAYAAVGLAGILEDARARQEEGRTDADDWSLWRRLTQLFVIVDDGDEALGVRPYNGGLFSDTEKPYLKAHKIANAYLAPALYALGFLPPGKSGPQLIDYRDLTVRHLGTLYEGLLEFKLNLVTGEAVIIREKDGKRQYIPQSQAGSIKRTEAILDVGQVYFADDKGERKASGSYYTPEDVVQYIVGNTVTPKLRQRLADLDRVLAEAQRERAVAASPEERLRIERYADQQTLAAVEEAALGLKVLDPAMGSAHFLVGAGQIITNVIVETLNRTPWPNDDLACDPLLWKRRVVERCLFGVDVNPLAQELAKLALWLSSASAGKPLTFLNHHLKVGNSLYGTPLARLGTLPETAKTKAKAEDKAKTGTETGAGPEAATLDIFDFLVREAIPLLLEDLKAIAGSDSDEIADVKWKERAYTSLSTSSQRLRDMANVWLATLFGLEDEEGKPLTQQGYADLRQACFDNHAVASWESYVNGDWRLCEARRIAEEHSFFHWELEFPEAVQDGRCAFDVVVANPPYVGRSPNPAISALYTTQKCGDLYAWIFERGTQVCAPDCSLGMVIPLSVTFSGQLSSLRKLILELHGTKRIASFDIRPSTLFGTWEAPNSQRTTIVLLDATCKGKRVFTTDLLRWNNEERPKLMLMLNATLGAPCSLFAETTKICLDAAIPKIGKSELARFWNCLTRTQQCIRNITVEILGESQRPSSTDIALTVPRAARYFISATPGTLARNKILSLVFESPDKRDLARVLINSNVFYWYWRAFGDGFLVNVDLVGSFPVPNVIDDGYHELVDELDKATAVCTSFNMFRGDRVPSYNFNRRMDILLRIDDWIVRQVAPDLDLPRDIFAQYKSNSFLRPLDLNTLFAAEEATEDA